jgi:hypothetical protein
MPFLVVSSQFTTYSLSVSLKSKWSQRMYELCQNGEQMVLEYPLKIYEKLCFLENKYPRYALLNDRVLQSG